MAIAQAVTCDVCGKVKGSVNHWFVISRQPGGFTSWPWDDEIAQRFDHACGRECAQKAFEQWMQDQAA